MKTYREESSAFKTSRYCSADKLNSFHAFLPSLLGGELCIHDEMKSTLKTLSPARSCNEGKENEASSSSATKTQRNFNFFFPPTFFPLTVFKNKSCQRQHSEDELIRLFLGRRLFSEPERFNKSAAKSRENLSLPQSRLNSLCFDVPDNDTGILGTGHQMIGVLGNHHTRYRSAMPCERDDKKLAELTCKHGL